MSDAHDPGGGRSGLRAAVRRWSAAGSDEPGTARPQERAAPSPDLDVRRLVALACVGVVAVLASLPGWVGAGFLHTMVEVLVLLALAQLWNLLAGHAGLVSLGQPAFVGAGAYTLVVLADDVGVQVFLAVPAAAVVAGVVSVPIAALVLRLRGGHFAVVTLVVAETLMLVVVNNTFLGGGDGRTLAQAAEIDRGLREDTTYWLALALGVGAVVTVHLVGRSRLGLGLAAARDDEAAAAGLGVDVGRTTLLAWVIAAAGAGAVGAVVGLDAQQVRPLDAFGFASWTVPVVLIVIIGGMGTIEGPVIGTIVYVVLRNLLFDGGPWFLVLLGAVAVALVVVAPGGLWGLLQRRWPVDVLSPPRRRSDRTR